LITLAEKARIAQNDWARIESALYNIDASVLPVETDRTFIEHCRINYTGERLERMPQFAINRLYKLYDRQMAQKQRANADTDNAA
jgi:hypothetical protein